MCGRYALALRPSRVRQLLQQDNLQVDDAPEDEGDDAPRPSYNFAPGYHGIVYRADVPDWGAGPRRAHASHDEDDKPAGDDTSKETATKETATARDDTVALERRRYKLQSMKWGLIPSWTKRRPDYATALKTINCRSDSLAAGGAGMWASMKARKRCVVVAQGFYEWLKKGPKEKVPHFVRRADGRLMCFAGLWDCVVYEGDGERERKEKRNYTYTIVTTDSNPQLKFLHDRMPVILEQGSEALKTWLDPERSDWGPELQGVLKPYEGELEVYPVSKDVGKVGNDSPSFIIPVASKDNKSNIANFFATAKESGKDKEADVVNDAKSKEKVEPEVEVVKEDGRKEIRSVEEEAKEGDDGGMGQDTVAKKRRASLLPSEQEPPQKKQQVAKSPSPRKGARPQISAMSNTAKNSAKVKAMQNDGSQKITKFFANSA